MEPEETGRLNGGYLVALAVFATALGVPMLFLFPLFWAAIEVIRFRRRRPDDGFGMNREEYDLATEALQNETNANEGLVDVFERAEEAGCRPRSDGMWKEKHPKGAELNAARLNHEEELKRARWNYHVARSGPSSRFSAWRAATSAAWGARSVAFTWAVLAMVFPAEARALLVDSISIFGAESAAIVDVMMRAMIPVSAGLLAFVTTFWIRAKFAGRHRPLSSSKLIDHYAEHYVGTHRERVRRDLSRTLVDRISEIDDVEDDRELEIVSMAAIMRFVVSADGQFSEDEKAGITNAEAELVGDDEEERALFRAVFESTAIEEDVLDAAIRLQALLLDSPEEIEESSLLVLVESLAANEDLSTEESYRLKDVRQRMIGAWREIEDGE